MKSLHLSSFLLLPFIGYSQGQIYQIDNVNNFAAAVLSDKFEYYQSFQFQENWCWAACTQMVLSYQGIGFEGTISEQCDIVKKAFKIDECYDTPADCYAIKSGADGWIIDGRKIKATVTFTLSADDLINQLANKYPVIIGLNMPNQNIGHAYVLTAIFFQQILGKYVPYKVVLRDPYPYDSKGVEKPARQEFSWDDFKNRVNCITYVTF